MTLSRIAQTCSTNENQKKITIFTYKLGDTADKNITKTIACNTGWIWTYIGNTEANDIISAMSSYYQLNASDLGRALDENENFVAWVVPYTFASFGKLGTSVSVPVYDQSVTPNSFVDVLGIDIYTDTIERILKINEAKAMDWFINKTINKPLFYPVIVNVSLRL